MNINGIGNGNIENLQPLKLEPIGIEPAELLPVEPDSVYQGEESEDDSQEMALEPDQLWDEIKEIENLYDDEYSELLKNFDVKLNGSTGDEQEEEYNRLMDEMKELKDDRDRFYDHMESSKLARNKALDDLLANMDALKKNRLEELDRMMEFNTFESFDYHDSNSGLLGTFDLQIPDEHVKSDHTDEDDNIENIQPFNPNEPIGFYTKETERFRADIPETPDKFSFLDNEYNYTDSDSSNFFMGDFQSSGEKRDFTSTGLDEESEKVQNMFMKKED